MRYKVMEYSNKDISYYSKRGLLTRIFIKELHKDNVEYTKEEFINKFINEPIFNKMYDKWVKSGYKRQFNPLIRKIKSSLDYNLNNIQCIENNE